MKIAGYLMVTMFSALYILLAVQAEPTTATLGFVASGILMLSLVVSIVKGR